jgi:hypothetical protein
MALKKNRGKKGAARRSTIHVGDLVQIKFGAGDVMGQVVEDRGRIGFKGRNLYRILVTMDAGEPMNIELPAEEIRIARRASAAKKVARPRAAKVRTAQAQRQTR